MSTNNIQTVVEPNVKLDKTDKSDESHIYQEMTVYQAIWMLSVKITISQNPSILIWILNLRNAHVRGHAHVEGICTIKKN